jgi:hypothetical protein
VVDHHVDRPEVEAGQPAQLTGTNRSMHWSARTQRQEPSGSRSQAPGTRYRRAANLSSKKTHTHNSLPQIGRIEGLGQSRRAVLMSEPPISAIRKPGGHSEGCSTRSHPELGRENPQRRWYCRSSGGRVGRRQAFADGGGRTTEEDKPICRPAFVRRPPITRGGAAR